MSDHLMSTYARLPMAFERGEGAPAGTAAASGHQNGAAAVGIATTTAPATTAR